MPDFTLSLHLFSPTTKECARIAIEEAEDMREVTSVSLENAIDTHVHVGPSPFERPWDDTETARMAAAKSMQAILLKSHFESTVSRAYHAAKAVPDIKVFGGIVLNRYVGGFNPAAVEVALVMGGKEVWMPSIDSAHHAKVYGSTGTYQLKGVDTGARMARTTKHTAAEEGLSILKEDKSLKDEVKEIVELVAQYDAIVGTCHLFREEIFKLVEYARTIGAKALITHPYQLLPDLTLDDLRELVQLGAVIEFAAATTFGPASRPERTFQFVKESIDIIGAEHVIIVSDAGSSLTPPPPATLRMFGQWLQSLGVEMEDLHTMMVENPKRLLNL
jgi:hypothetical protein